MNLNLSVNSYFIACPSIIPSMPYLAIYKAHIYVKALVLKIFKRNKVQVGHVR